jgi:hypothetical protein
MNPTHEHHHHTAAEFMSTVFSKELLQTSSSCRKTLPLLLLFLQHLTNCFMHTTHICKKEREEEQEEKKKVHCVHTRKLTPQACMHIGSSNRVPTLNLI